MWIYKYDAIITLDRQQIVDILFFVIVGARWPNHLNLYAFYCTIDWEQFFFFFFLWLPIEDFELHAPTSGIKVEIAGSRHRNSSKLRWDYRHRCWISEREITATSPLLSLDLGEIRLREEKNKEGSMFLWFCRCNRSNSSVHRRTGRQRVPGIGVLRHWTHRGWLIAWDERER